MLFSINKNTACALVAAATILAAGAAAAREDGGGGWSVRHGPAPVAAIAPQSLTDIEPAAGGTLVVAATPPAIATPRLSKPASAGARLGTFGSVAISAARLPSATKWRNATDGDFSALFTEGCAASGLGGCNTDLARQLRMARAAADGKSAAAAIRTINSAVNAALRYSPDSSVWGTGDYWATPTEIALKGAGDCEDFAITKLWLLRSLGYSADQLQLVVLQDTRRNLYHAVLAVHVDGRRYILDNLSDTVATDAAYPSYLPIMSFVGGKSYIHGFENRREDTAGMPRDLAEVMPGEGV